MTYYELKRIIARPSTKILYVLLITVMLVVVGLSISTVEWLNDKGESTKGIVAINKIRDEKKQWSGWLTEDVIAKVIDKNREYNNSIIEKSDMAENIAYAKKQGFDDIRHMINYSFSDFREYDYYKVDTLSEENANRFYQNRVENLSKWLEGEGAQFYTEVEKKYYINQYERMDTPLKYEYMDGWKTLVDNVAIVITIMAIVICLIISNLFSSEKQYHEEPIFYSTYYGRNKGILAKLKAGFIITTGIYVSILMIFTFSILGIFGADGSNCMIQVSGAWKSFYNITIFQEYLLIFIGGYIACLFLSMLTMFVSAVSTSAVFSSMISFITILLPSVIMTLPFAENMSGILGLFPDQLLNINDIVLQFNVYCIGGTVINPINILLPLYLLLTIILVPLTYNAYKIKELK